MSRKKYLPVLQAIEETIGYRPDPTTGWRWSTKGRGGVKLKTWMVGGRRMTTIEAVESFIEERTKQTTPRESSTVREKLNEELGL